MTSVMRRYISWIVFAALLVDSYALPVTPGSEVVRRTEVTVAPTQYHATCATSAKSIQKAMESKTFVLRPGRKWPDEFTWSGGFYMTPDQGNAIAFGADFLTSYCADKGGVEIMKFNFDSSHLVYVLYGSEGVILSSDSFIGVKTLGTTAQQFFDRQEKLGSAIENYVEHSPSSQPLSENDRNPSQPAKFAPPNQEQIADIREDTSSSYRVPGDLWSLYDDFAKYDVVSGAVPMKADQQAEMAIAVKAGMPAIQDPFVQVVLVTDTGKHPLPLKFISQQPLDPSLAQNQPALHQASKRQFGAGRRGEFKLTALL
ncbi:hypothetical protein C8R44DRAFT_725164 [Mycena epipterygia]|nr:hypothetical protein C8R44DRAFT_725164 [Mycena epipterygia]